MGPERVRPWWPAVVLAAVGLTFLYAGELSTRFLNDDYLFLEEARARPLAESLAQLGALGNYYRLLSRQIYFETLASLADGHALVFHAVNYALFLAALALLADLLRVLVPPAGAVAGCLYFAVLPLHGVNLTWVSCSQDLMALTGVLGALALYRRGRVVGSALCYVAAIARRSPRCRCRSRSRRGIDGSSAGHGPLQCGGSRRSPRPDWGGRRSRSRCDRRTRRWRRFSLAPGISWPATRT